MSNRRTSIRFFFQSAIIISTLGISLTAQAVSSITGSVVDEIGQPIRSQVLDLVNLNDEIPRQSTISTDMNGQFTFADLSGGNYLLTIRGDDVYDFVSSTAGDSGQAVGPNSVTDIMLGTDDDVSGYQFELGLNERYSIVSGFVYHDKNNNGIKDGSERGLQGVSLNARTPGGFDAVATDANGKYSFALEKEKSWEIVQLQPESWVDGQEVSSVPIGVTNEDAYSEIILTGGERVSGYNFGEQMRPDMALIVGSVYFDRNNNGIKESGEPGIPGVTFEARGDSRFPDLKTSDPEGRYELWVSTNVESWSIVQTQPMEWKDGKETTSIPVGVPGVTDMGDDRYSELNLQPGDFVSGYDFGELLPDNPTISLRSGTWEMISIPGDSGNYTIEYALANENLPAEDYGMTWIVFSFDPNLNEYIKVPIDGSVRTGAGFWITQITGQDVTLNFTQLAMPNPEGFCTGSGNSPCYLVDLVSREEQQTWNIAGSVTGEVLDFKDLGFSQFDQFEPCVNGCSAQEAIEEGVIVGSVWVYNSDQNLYERVLIDSTVMPGKAFFLLAGPGKFGLEMKVPLNRTTGP